MKYKHLAMLMGVMITATSVGSTATAFAADSKTESTQDADDTTEDTAEASDEKADDSKEETNENEILGEVKSVEDGKITIAVGTRKEMSQPGEQPQGGEIAKRRRNRMEMMQRQMAMPKVLKMQTVKKQTMPAQTSHQIQMKKQKILNQRMTHPQITQTKAKRQMVTVMVRELRTEKHHPC